MHVHQVSPRITMGLRRVMCSLCINADPSQVRRRKQRCRPASLHIAEAHLLQSRVYLRQRKLVLAEEQAEACIELRRIALTMQHPAVAEALLGALLSLTSLQHRTRLLLGTSAMDSGDQRCAGCAEILFAAGKLNIAKIQAKKALSLYMQTLGDGHSGTTAAASLMMRCSATTVVDSNGA